MRSRLLVPGQLYRFRGSNHYLFKYPRVGTIFERLGTIDNNALVMYVTKAKDREYRPGLNKCVMVKVVSGDMIGWIGITHIPPFIPETHFIKASDNEIPGEA